jgi:hypothetical protein
VQAPEDESLLDHSSAHQPQHRRRLQEEFRVAPKPISWWKRTASWPLKIVTAAGVVIAAVAGALGLLFQFEPSLRRCQGGSRASFTAAPVFPNVVYRHFLYTNYGWSYEQIKNVAGNGVRGAEVRFLYAANSLRGDPLWLYATLVTVNPEGAVTGIVPSLDQKRQYAIVPTSCAESGGHDVFLAPIPNSRAHYRILLELYRGQHPSGQNAFQPRLALTETPVFRG